MIKSNGRDKYIKYPVGKNKDDYISQWYIASGFGEWREKGAYYHEAIDLNLKSGGNSDLGQPIYAISNWSMAYYHYGSHPTTGFGKHYVYQIDGSWGTRWIHCAHNQDVIKTGGDSGSEGDQLSTLGMSGTTLAHLHFSIFKVDPKTLRNGIDTIAKTKEELNAWWESPVPFIEKWMDPPIDYKALSEQLEKELDEKKIQVGNLQGQVTGLMAQVKNLGDQLGIANSTIKALTDKIESLNNIVGEYQKDDAVQISQLKSAQDKANEYSNAYFLFLNDVRYELKLGVAIGDADEANNEALVALQKLAKSTDLLNDRIKELETLSKPVADLTIRELILQLYKSIFR